MMEVRARHRKALALLTLLTLAAVNVDATIPKCIDNCGVLGKQCQCGAFTCDATQGCGYATIGGDKACFTGSSGCNVRGWVVSGRILCVMYLLAPYVAFAMIVLGSIYIMLGTDRPEQKEQGKRWIRNAIIGGLLVVALIAIANAYLGMGITSYSYCLTLGG